MNSLQKQKIPAAVSKRKTGGGAKILYHQYSKEKYACRIDLPQICELPEPDNVWIECGSGISRELTDRLGKRFGFNKLILEDAAVVPQPPKLDEYDDSCFFNAQRRRLERAGTLYRRKSNVFFMEKTTADFALRSSQ